MACGVLSNTIIPLLAHRKGPKLELDDVRLAIQSRVNNSFTQPPPRELMLELASERNSQPLDVVPKKFGVLLPPESQQVAGQNYQIDFDANEKNSKKKGAKRGAKRGRKKNNDDGGVQSMDTSQ